MPDPTFPESDSQTPQEQKGISESGQPVMTESSSLVDGLKGTYSTTQNSNGGFQPSDDHTEESPRKGEDCETDAGCSCGDCKCACKFSIPLLFCKIFYFSFVGGLGCVLPYVSIYLKQMGLSPQEIGLISGLRPLVGFISAPVYGALGDRFKIRRWLLLGSVVAWLAFYVGLLFVSPPARVDTCPGEEFHLPDKILLPSMNVVKRDLEGSSEATERQQETFPFIDERLRGNSRQKTSDVQEVDLSDIQQALAELLPHNATVQGNGTNWTLAALSGEQRQAMTEYLGWLYDPDSLFRVFIIVLCLIVAGETVQAPTSALADAGTLQMLEEDGLGAEGYGSQRAWGALGFGLR